MHRLLLTSWGRPNSTAGQMNMRKMEKQWILIMHLAHAGYYLFLAKQEVGWFEYASPIGDYHLPRRKFVDFGRSVLVQQWRAERMSDLHRFTSELVRLPADRRSDLAAFLSVLREY